MKFNWVDEAEQNIGAEVAACVRKFQQASESKIKPLWDVLSILLPEA